MNFLFFIYSPLVGNSTFSLLILQYSLLINYCMRLMKWVGITAAIVLIVSCFIPWVVIESKNIMVSGIDAAGTDYGKPGYFHFIMVFFFLIFSFTARIWAKRCNLLVIAMNFAWAIRNYFVITACQGGDCPEKKAGIYLVVLTSVLMMVAALFPDMKLPGEKEKKNEPG
jgi:hypothetical protein